MLPLSSTFPFQLKPSYFETPLFKKHFKSELFLSVKSINN